MTVLYSTSDQARAYERSAARGLAYEAQDRMDDLRRLVPEAARLFRDLKALGHSEPWLEDAINGLLDQVANIQGECREPASAVLGGFVEVDTTELHRLTFVTTRHYSNEWTATEAEWAIGMPVGYGNTEADAIGDLEEKILTRDHALERAGACK